MNSNVKILVFIFCWTLADFFCTKQVLIQTNLTEFLFNFKLIRRSSQNLPNWTNYFKRISFLSTVASIYTRCMIVMQISSIIAVLTINIVYLCEVQCQSSVCLFKVVEGKITNKILVFPISISENRMNRHVLTSKFKAD